MFPFQSDKSKLHSWADSGYLDISAAEFRDRFSLSFQTTKIIPWLYPGGEFFFVTRDQPQYQRQREAAERENLGTKFLKRGAGETLGSWLDLAFQIVVFKFWF